MENKKRVAKGVPTGGQFAADERGVSDVTLPARLDDPAEFDFLAQNFENQVTRIADDLRTLAKRIESIQRPKPDQDNPGFSEAASEVTSQVMSALPNLGLGHLQQVAGDSDISLLRRRAER